MHVQWIFIIDYTRVTNIRIKKNTILLAPPKLSLNILLVTCLTKVTTILMFYNVD